MKYTHFTNGQPMYDTDGKKICLQFPHIICDGGKYYLYGTNREFSKGGTCHIWHWGIKMYKSDDLYNWTDLGLIIPPNEDDPSSVLYPERFLDTPNIIYNAQTRKYVCWFIDMNKGVYTYVSDSLLGPYTPACEGFLPCGVPMGDFDLCVQEDGRAYVFFNHPHREIICAELTDDYTSVKGTYTAMLPHPEGPPYNREAPSYMKRNGKHYLITSGTTTFYPNPSEAAVCDTVDGTYQFLCDPHVDDPSQTSFHSQIRSIFKVPGKKELYIALADRWLPHLMDLPYELYKKWHEVSWSNAYTAEEKEASQREHLAMFPDSEGFYFDLSKAQQVWLPIHFEGDTPHIYWRETWSLDEFEDV